MKTLYLTKTGAVLTVTAATEARAIREAMTLEKYQGWKIVERDKYLQVKKELQQ